jgi:type I restriction enzyme S subunit
MWNNVEVVFLTLEAIGKICHCGEVPPEKITDRGIPLYKIGTMGGGTNEFISEETFEECKRKYPYPKTGSVLISVVATIGKLFVFDGSPSYFQGSRIVWIDNDEKIVLNKYLYYIFQSIGYEKWGKFSLSNEVIYKTQIPCPPFWVQRESIRMLEKMEALIGGEVSSIEAEINKRKKQIEYYRDDIFDKLEVFRNDDISSFDNKVKAEPGMLDFGGMYGN